MFRISIFGSSGNSSSADYSRQLIDLGASLSCYRIEIIVGSTTGVVGEVLEGINNGPKNCKITLVSYGDLRYIDFRKLDQIIQKDDYFSRLRVLCDSDLFITLDGHLGTMAETVVTWNVLQSNMDLRRKILIFGKNEEHKISLLKS